MVGWIDGTERKRKRQRGKTSEGEKLKRFSSTAASMNRRRDAGDDDDKMHAPFFRSVTSPRGSDSPRRSGKDNVLCVCSEGRE